MTSVRLLQTCCISTSLNALFSRDSPLSIPKVAVAVSVVAAKRTPTARLTAAPSWNPRWRRPHRRACSWSWSAHHTPFRRRRTSGSAYHPPFLLKTPPPPHSFTPFILALRRMEAARRDRLQHMEATVPLSNSIDDAMLLPGTPSPVSRPRKGGHERHTSVAATRCADDSVPPSPTPSRHPPAVDFPETTSTRPPTRSGSTASRSTNRLSLTLPIAPPSAYPSRPTPGSTTTTSFPPTPLDTPSVLSPTDPSDFITAIAAQERRVLELDEDLRTAKHELDRLKRQFMNYEASRERQRERHSRRNVEPLRPIAAALDGGGGHDPVAATTTRNAELDRRKALLLNQSTAQQQLNSPTTTENSRRRVFSGAHTRTLSLLSPTKPDPSGFPTLHESPSPSLPDPYRQQHHDTSRHPPITRGHVAKRASWAPRSTPLPPSGVKQIAQDLKHGIWTFVEDLRQATVGDEPITGDRRRPPHNDDTIRALPSARPNVTSLFSDEPEQERRTLTRSNTDVGATAKTKRFSWTPLTVDAYDDNDWSNWDSPGAATPAAAQRWSGTTVNGDIIPSVPPTGDGSTPL